MSPRAVDKRARPGNEATPKVRVLPVADEEGDVAELVPEVATFERGIVGTLDDLGTDD
jgi:hypothetical protein